MDRGKRRCRLHSSAASGEQGGGFPAQPGDPLDVRSHVPPVQSLPKLRGPPETLPAQLLLEQGSGGQLLQVDVLCGAGVLQVLLVVLQEGAAHALGHRPHGLLGDKDVAGKAAQQRVFGDEAKITAVAGVAATERDVLHLEEVAAVLELGSST